MALICNMPLKQDVSSISKNRVKTSYIPSANLPNPTFESLGGRFGLKFDGTGSHISFEDDYDFTPRTIALWFLPGSILTSRALFLFSGADEIERFEVHTESDRRLRFILTNINGTDAVPNDLIFDTGTNVVVENNWNHLVVTTKKHGYKNAEEVHLYLNGVYLGGKVFPYRDWKDLFKKKMVFGNRTSNPNVSTAFYNYDGLMSDIQVFSHPVSQDMVNKLYTKRIEEPIEDNTICNYYLDKSLVSNGGIAKPLIPINCKFDEDLEIGNHLATNYFKYATSKEMFNFMKWKKFSISCWIKAPRHNLGYRVRENILSFEPFVTGSFHLLIEDDRVLFGSWNAETCSGPIISIIDNKVRDILCDWTHIIVEVDNIFKTTRLLFNGEVIGSTDFFNDSWMMKDEIISMQLGGPASHGTLAQGGSFPSRTIKIKHLKIQNDDIYYYDEKYTKDLRYRGSTKPILHIPLSGNTYNISDYGFDLSGTVSYSSDGVIGLSAVGPFDSGVIGRGKYLASLMEREFTIMFWYKESKVIPVDKINPIIGKSHLGGNSDGNSVNIYFTNTNLVIKLHATDNTCTDILIERAAIVDIDLWNHYAITFSGSYVNIYVNGNILINKYIGEMKRLNTLNIDKIAVGNFLDSATYITDVDSFRLNDMRIYNSVIEHDIINRVSKANILDFKVDSRSEYQTNILVPNIYDLGPYTDLENLGSGHPGALLPAMGWSTGYNAGVPEANRGYHAYWNRIEGIMTLVFKNKNSSIGQNQRWMGVQCNTTSFAIEKNDVLTISFEMKEFENTKHCTNVGIHHALDSNSTLAFYSGQYNLYCEKLNVWEHKTVTFKMHSDLKVSDWATLYIYGHHGGEGVSYIRNVKIEKSSHSTPYSEQILIPHHKNMIDIHPVDLRVDASGFTKQGTCHKRMNGSMFINDSVSNTRLRYILPMSKKFKPLTRYTVSVDIKDLTFNTEDDRASKTYRFQVQYYTDPPQLNNDVIWSDRENINPGSISGNKSIVNLKNGWKRIIFTFSFIPPLSNTNTNSVLWFQGGADYTGYTRSYLIKNLRLIEGIGDPNLVRFALEDNSTFNNGGITESTNALYINDSIRLDTENFTKMERIKFDKLYPTTDFTYYMKFKLDTPTVDDLVYHFLGHSFGSQMDGLAVNRAGDIFFNRFSYNSQPNTESRVNLNANIKLNEWQELSVNYSNKTKKIQVYVNGVLMSTTDIELTPWVGSKHTFGVNAGSSIGNWPNRMFNGYVKSIAVFGRSLTFDEVKDFLDINIKIKPSGDILCNRIEDKRYMAGNVQRIGGLVGSNECANIPGYYFYKADDSQIIDKEYTFRLNLGMEIFQKAVLTNGSNSMASIVIETMTDTSWIQNIRPTDVNDSTTNFSYSVHGKFIFLSFTLTNFNSIYQFLNFKLVSNVKSTVGFKIHRFFLNGLEFDFSNLLDYKNIYRNTNMLNYTYLTPFSQYSSEDWKVQDYTSTSRHNTIRVEENQNCEPDVMMGNTFADGMYEGGFDVDAIQVHTNNIYRFSILLRRPVCSTGYEYFGSVGPRLTDSVSATGNLYFAHPHADTLNASGIGTDWHLLVFYIVRNADGYGYNGTHGLYKIHASLDMELVPKLLDTTLPSDIYNNQGNFKFTSINEFTTITCRSYLYYCGTNVDSCRFYRPRVDVCDGTEPSIAELLMGLEHSTLPFIENPFSFNDRIKLEKYFNVFKANRIQPFTN